VSDVVRRVSAVPSRPLPLITWDLGGEGFLVVNRGLSTVYIGDGTVDAFTGVPLLPLASLSITSDREWWVVADDTAIGPQSVYVVLTGVNYSPSPSEVAAQILSTGITLRDNPVLIDIGLNQLVPFTGTVVGVSQYQSFILSVQYEAANAGPPQNTGVITLEWGDTAAFGNVLGRQTYEINSVNTTDCGRTTIVDRHAGPFMRVLGAAGNGAASTATYVLYGSYRPVDTPRVYELGPTIANGLSTDLVALWLGRVAGAGLTIANTARIGTGAAILQLSFSAAGGPYNVSLISPQQGAARPFFQRTGLAVGGEFTYQIQLPRRALYISITNTGGANGNAFATLTMERY
jgi:hypothetical protein